MRWVMAVCVVGAALGCGSEPMAPPRLVRASVRRLTDTVRFEAPAMLRRCQDARGLLVEAARTGNGMLVWLRGTADSAAGPFPVVGVRDTTSARGAVVAVRFIYQAAAHTISLDSGAVAVSDSGGAMRLEVTGAGLDLAGGSRPQIFATFDPLPAPVDSASCARGP